MEFWYGCFLKKMFALGHQEIDFQPSIHAFECKNAVPPKHKFSPTK